MAKYVFTPAMARRNKLWNRGYSDGYNRLPSQVDMSDVYYNGYEVGKNDRDEDDEAVASGDFDLLSEEERKQIYGDERDRI